MRDIECECINSTINGVESFITHERYWVWVYKQYN